MPATGAIDDGYSCPAVINALLKVFLMIFMCLGFIAINDMVADLEEWI